ncbi:RDD family protein [Angustibacter luteus]|uniref:RDD family protein n=1 Tax=Angustibacter luteus TaxID=658456 RepID=A0ABW1JAY6_9ACTN
MDDDNAEPVAAAAADYPGERLGLPEEGRGSVARIGRRLAALALDWGLALLISRVLLHGNEWVTLGVFAAFQAVFVSAFNAGPGHLALGLRVTRVDGAAVDPLRALGRAVLLSLAVPALIWDRDQRGLHDQFMGTVLRRA